MQHTYRLALVALSISIVLPLAVGCSAASPARTSSRVETVGMVLATGGLGDRSFNDSAYAGLQDAQKRYGIRFETADFTTADGSMAALRRFATQEYDLIIGVGFENGAPLGVVAKEFPNRRFAIIDTVVDGANVASIVYREQEGDFLMGILAAMLTKTKSVGFIGGADIPAVRRIEGGFKQGVQYQESAVTVVSVLAGTFSEPDKGKALALAQYQQGVDIIYNGAGRTGLGIIEAAKETGKLTIGTSGDQRYMAPGNVVGNRPKRVDTAVLTLVEDVRKGKFAPGTRSLGLKEGGLALGPFDTKIVTKAMLDRLETIKKQVISGAIVVRDVGESN